jgi:hypothetical protein
MPGGATGDIEMVGGTAGDFIKGVPKDSSITRFTSKFSLS